MRMESAKGRLGLCSNNLCWISINIDYFDEELFKIVSAMSSSPTQIEIGTTQIQEDEDDVEKFL